MRPPSRRLVVLFAFVGTACGGKKRPPVMREVPAPVVVAPAGAPERAVARVVAFVGEPVNYQVQGAGPFVMEPVPVGWTFDATTGRLAGAGATPDAVRLHVRDASGTEQIVTLEVIPAPAAGDRFVDPDGNDAWPGSRAQPFRTIRRALSGIAPGVTIFLGPGRYREDVSLANVRGEPERPIVLRSLPGGLAAIEGAHLAVSWERARGPGAASHEWISRERFERTAEDSNNRGVLGRRTPFTRLLTYSKLEDLRSTNEELMVNDTMLPGARTPKGHHMPWTYMGPGLWHDPASGRIHLRLAPTSHGVRGMPEFTGPTDPSSAGVMVWSRASRPLAITRSAHIEIRDVLVLGGGEETVLVEKSEDVLFDHVDIHAATMGLVIGASTRVRYRHGRIDGGIPPWSFRSDFKADYHIARPDGQRVKNNLVRKTSRALVYVAGATSELEISHCELENAHDIYMAGIRASLHHCRIRNIHDEALFVSHVSEIDDLRIHDNVFERVLTGVSGVGAKRTGPRYIYRNIFDLRDPTASFRPGASPRGFTWRWGHMFKGVLSAAPFYFYQNTVVVRADKPGKPALWHYHALQPEARDPNWFVNNVVVVVGADPGPLAFMPDPDYQATSADGRPLILSDGNVWVRPGGDRAPLFRCKQSRRGDGCATKKWRTLDALRAATGFDRRSKFATIPKFARVRSLEAGTPGDDLRPMVESPIIGAAIELPRELPDNARARPRRDAGALPLGAPPLEVGVDGRWRY